MSKSCDTFNHFNIKYDHKVMENKGIYTTSFNTNYGIMTLTIEYIYDIYNSRQFNRFITNFISSLYDCKEEYINPKVNFIGIVTTNMDDSFTFMNSLYQDKFGNNFRIKEYITADTARNMGMTLENLNYKCKIPKQLLMNFLDKTDQWVVHL